jgi:hypothetical protein
MPESVVLNIMKYAGEVKDKVKLHKLFVFCKHLQGIKCYIYCILASCYIRFTLNICSFCPSM